MSCDAAALALTLRLASYRPDVETPRLVRAVASAPLPSSNPLAQEPLFRDIVSHAATLRTRVDGWRRTPRALTATEAAALDAEARALSDLDLQGHLTLARRGADGDLKCILKGLSQDLPRRVADLSKAPDLPARKAALDELFYLLRDNVEVVTTPAKTE